MKIAVPMTPEMVAFLDINADRLSDLMDGKTTRADIVRESISRIAWDYFGEDIE